MTEEQKPPLPNIQIIAAPQPDDEISLRELWERLMRGKRTILLVTILFLALAGAYLGLSTTIYESKGMVQIGRVSDKPIADGPQLASQLMNAYTPLNTEVAARQLPKLYTVTADEKDPTILTLVARGKSPAQAQAYLQDILKRLITDQGVTYHQAVQYRQTQLARLQQQYQSIIETATPTKLRQVPHSNYSQGALALLAQSTRMSVAAGLLGQIAAAQNALSSVSTHPTVITLQATYDPEAVKPKKLVILILALFGGLIMGIFVVLLRDALATKAIEL